MIMKHKPIDKEFTLKAHTYTQIRREGDVAIYKQTLTDGKGEATPSFEVVKIGRHNGYTIGGAYIEPAETYPGATQWGVNGFTCKSLKEADEKFEKLKLDKTPVVVDGVVVKKKGKAKIEVKIVIPVGKFSAKEFADSCKVQYALGFLRMKELIKKGEIKFVEEKRMNPKGKKTKFFTKV